jgi:hypothetical protein
MRRDIYHVIGRIAVGLLLALTAGTLNAAPAAAAVVQKTIQGHINGEFSVSPDRVEMDVVPGKPSIIQMRLINAVDSPVTVALSMVDVGASSKPGGLVQIVKHSQYSAASWVVPDTTGLHMPPLGEADFNLTVTPPIGAPVGTNSAGLAVAVQADNSKTTGNNRISFKVQGLVQLFFDVPGKIKHDVKVSSATIDDSFIFGGQRIVAYELGLRNNGNVNETISGKINVDSLFGNATKTLDVPPLVVLRGSTRSWRIIWDGTPRFGRFTAVGDLHSDSQEHLTAHFPAVTVLPPWWWFLIAFIVLLIPLARWWYERQFGWRKYLDEDDDWDEDWDDDAEWDDLGTI